MNLSDANFIRLKVDLKNVYFFAKQPALAQAVQVKKLVNERDTNKNVSIYRFETIMCIRRSETRVRPIDSKKSHVTIKKKHSSQQNNID